jgi:FAD/FMN-containing dehydrogenase
MEKESNMSDLVKEIKAILGEDRVLTDQHTLNDNCSDLIGYRRWERFHGSYLAPKPLCVAKVNSAEEVSAVFKAVNGRTNIVPASGKSCVTEGLRTTEGAIVLDGSSMNEVVSFDTTNYLVTVKSGTPLEYLEGHCNLRGYSTGHFPQSLPMAHVGGLVATRSIGQLSSLYGGIEDMVVGLEAVLPTGEIVRIKNVPRRAAGNDLRHLFIGSEGTLGFITEVTLRLFKLPADKWQCAYGMPNMDVGLEAIREIMQEGWKPAVVRLHDEYEAEESYGNFINEGENVLFFVAHGPEGVATLTGEAIEEICLKYGGRRIGPKLVDVWFERRNNVCYAIDRHSKAGNIGETIDISANWSEIGEIYKEVCRRGNEEIRDIVQFSAHSSHSYMQGTNMYFVVRFKATNDYDDCHARFQQAYEIVMGETLKRGGSIVHHHGVGKYRAPWMEREHGSSFILFNKLKAALDPQDMMNKGTLIPENDK